MPSKKRRDDALIWLMTDLKDRPLLIGFVNNGPADLMDLSLLLVTAAFSNFCGVYSMIQIANPFASRSNRSVTPPPNIRVIRDIPRRPTAIVSCCPLRASSRIFAATSSSWPNFKDTQLVSKPHCSSVSQAFLRTEHSASRSFRIHVSRSSRRRALNCSSTAGFSDPPCSNRTRGIGFNT